MFSCAIIICTRFLYLQRIRVYTETLSFRGTCQLLNQWSVRIFGFNSRARAPTVQWHSTETVVSKYDMFQFSLNSGFKNFFHPQPSPPWALRILFLSLAAIFFQCMLRSHSRANRAIEKGVSALAPLHPDPQGSAHLCYFCIGLLIGSWGTLIVLFIWVSWH